MKIFFSVVIPLFNKEKYILETVESVLNQSYENYELIVVNDGSTDDGVKVLSKLNDRRLIIYNKKNEGEGPARNYGIDKSKGDWIAFLDADDIWYSNHLNILSELIINNISADIVSNKIENIKNNSRIIKKPVFQRINYLKDVIKNPGIIHSSSVAIKRTTIKTLGYFLNNKTGVDTEYWLRAYLKNMKFYVSSEYTVFYRSNTGGAMDEDYKKLKKGFLYFDDLRSISLSVNTLLNHCDEENKKLYLNSLSRNYINQFIINRIKTTIIFEDSYSLKRLSGLLIISYSPIVIALKIINILPDILIRWIFMICRIYLKVKNN